MNKDQQDKLITDLTLFMVKIKVPEDKRHAIMAFMLVYLQEINKKEGQ